MNVLITGASSGIGLSVSKYFLKNNHQVFGLAHTDLIEDININFYKVDITDYEKTNLILEEIFQNHKIDILINCAGYGISGSIEDTKLEVIKKNLDVNYFSMINIVQKTIPHMRLNNGGKIAYLSSVASVLPIAFQTIYSSTKAGINLFSEALNIETKPFNIQNILFLPGDVKTNFTKNRQKNIHENPAYNQRIKKSISVMEKDEQNGLSSEYVAKIIYKNLMKKRLPIRKVVGKKYKVYVFLSRIFSHKFINKILGKIYG